MTSTSTSKPQLRVCNRAELARNLRVTPRHIANLEARGMPVLRYDGRTPLYDADACWHWYMDYRVKRLTAHPVTLSERDARARLFAAQANLRELTLEVRRGNLVTVDALAKRVEQLALQLRMALLAVPGQWAPLVAQCRTVKQVRAVLDKALKDVATTLDQA